MIQLNMRDRASDDLLVAAFKLQEAGYFATTQDVIDFFEKPWKWEVDLDEIQLQEDNEQ